MAQEFVIPVDPSTADAYGPNVVDGALRGNRVAVYKDGVFQGSIVVGQIDEDSGGINTSPDPFPTKGPTGIKNRPYSTQLDASGGVGPYTFDLAPGSDPLPTGLSLGTDGLLDGTPTVAGTAALQVRVTDANGVTGVRDMTLEVLEEPLRMYIPNIPPITKGQSASFQIVIDPNAADIAVTAGTLPAGLALDSGAGEISGTTVTAEVGDYPVTLTATLGGQTVSIDLTFHVILGPHAVQVFLDSLSTAGGVVTGVGVAVPILESNVGRSVHFLYTKKTLAGSPTNTVLVQFSSNGDDDGSYATIATLTAGSPAAVLPASAVAGDGSPNYVVRAKVTPAGGGASSVVGVAMGLLQDS